MEASQILLSITDYTQNGLSITEWDFVIDKVKYVKDGSLIS